MQNVTQAYKQTQAGTMGQGEVVVMLYDGALRFLSQAREKMLAKDYAAKGILISKTMDVLNELDSCLNMELGGELAKNLHQLYFLCNTRLLQANLKLDVAQLDSVVTILTSLRSAFDEILDNPDAQKAAASISQKNAAKAAGSVARPLSSGGNTPGMTPGSELLLQQGMPVGAIPHTPAQAAPGQSVPRPMAPGMNNPYLAAQSAPQVQVPPAEAAQAALQAQQQAVQAATRDLPPHPVRPAPAQAPQGAAMAEAILPPLPRLQGFTSKKMAAYGKLIQG